MERMEPMLSFVKPVLVFVVVWSGILFAQSEQHTFMHPPEEVQAVTKIENAQISWAFNLPDTVFTYNDGTPNGIYGPRKGHALGVVFDLSAMNDAHLKMIDFVHYSDAKLEGPYQYRVLIFDMDNDSLIAVTDTLTAKDANMNPGIEVAVDIGSIGVEGKTGVFIEGLSTTINNNGDTLSFPALMTDTSPLVSETSYYCTSTKDPFKADDPNFTNIFELTQIASNPTNFILDLWVSEGPGGEAFIASKSNTSDVSRYIDGFHIYRGKDIQSLETIASVGPQDRQFLDNEPHVDSSYVYAVSSYKDTVESFRTLSDVYKHPQLYTISEARLDDDGDYQPDRAGEVIAVSGIVNSPNFSSNTHFFLQDQTAGISLFADAFTAGLQVGDSVYVKGTVTQYNGLTEIRPNRNSDLMVLSKGNSLDTLNLAIGDIDESKEGCLIALENVKLTNTESWPAEGSNGRDVTVSKGQSSIPLFIDKDTNLDGYDWNPPSGEIILVGIVDQYTESDIPDDNYSIRPRYQTDFITVTAIQRMDGQKPANYNLSQNYPNPFNPATTIHFALPVKKQVSIDLFNALGQKLKQILYKEMPAGSYQLTINANHLASGIYYYRMQAGEYQATKKMIVVK
ncbi:MAG: T9SS type A sorting domain-containing protein [Caldithrix sp.]|nr:T9SS type A sorting domain-containing protein [Caldithrix sp.]